MIKTKLVIITGHYPYLHGEVFLNDEIKILSREFTEILIICGERRVINSPKFELEHNVKVVVVNRNYKLYNSIIYGLLCLLSKESYDEILYARRFLKYKFGYKLLKTLFLYYAVCNRLSLWIKNNLNTKENEIIFYSYWLSEGAYTLAKLKKQGCISKAISRAHGGDAFLDANYNLFRREIYSDIDQIYFVSEKALLQFENKVKILNPSKIAKLSLSHLGTKKNQHILNPLKETNKNQLIIVSCSMIIALKRLDLIIAALVNINNYNIKWVHFGDGIYREVIFKLIEKQLSHLSNIEIDFKGQVGNEEIQDYYQKQHIDLFINVSDYEGIPVSVMEAMSYGIPVIARNVGGNSEIVENGYNGILLPKQTSSQEISQSILALIDLPQDCIHKYRKNAFETWKLKFDAETNYKAFAKNIKEMLT